MYALKLSTLIRFLSISAILALSCNSLYSQTYCGDNGEIEFNQSTDYIDSVVFDNGAISNFGTGFSGGGYNDYTNLSAEVIPCGAYEITVKGEGTGTEYCVVYFDWDSDGEFEDELDLGSVNTAPYIFNGTVTVPNTAPSGINVRMRIAFQYNSKPGSCPNGNYGEVEDYSLNIGQGTIMSTNSINLEGANTNPVLRNTKNQEIAQILYTTDGCTPIIDVDKFSFNHASSTSIAADVTRAALLHSATNDINTGVEIGNTNTLGATFDINTTFSLLPGDNYFWLVYDIDANATPGNFVDAEFVSIEKSGAETGVESLNFNPPGNRVVFGEYCKPTVSNENGDLRITKVSFANYVHTSGYDTLHGAPLSRNC